jgi:hypothetical protein
MVMATLWYLGMTIASAVTGNPGAAVGFGCTTVALIILMFVTLDLDFYIDHSKNLTDLCNDALEESRSLVELNERISNTSKEVHDMNRELIDDNHNLLLTIDKMKKYLTAAELYEVNKEIADTGYKFLETDDGEFEMFVTRERKEVSED